MLKRKQNVQNFEQNGRIVKILKIRDSSVVALLILRHII